MKTGENRALIHVDILNDFISGTLAVPGGEEILHLVDCLTRDALDKNDVLVFLADCHPSETEHFLTWPRHCVKDTHGQKFHSHLWIPDGSFVVFKGTGNKNNGYSGFDKDNVEVFIKHRDKLLRLSFSTLEELLDSLEVGHADIDGLATNYCDKATAIDSANLGYKTRLILDACRGIPHPAEYPDSVENALKEMKEAKVEITTTAKVLH